MLIKFEAFLAELEKHSVTAPPEVRKRLDEMLIVGVGAQAKRNIYDERLMDDAEWVALTDAILKVPCTFADVTAAIRQVLRKHKLQGTAARLPSRAVFGRAVTHKSLAQTLHGQAALGTLESAIHHVAFYKNVRAASLKIRWRNILLGRHVTWSTVDPAGGDPFGFTPTPRQGREIAPVLGLPEETRLEPLLLMRYELPSGVVARIPRITEAYAGDLWLYYFRPADADDVARGYGRTYVWDSYAKSHAGRPEIVHEPVTGEFLTADLEEAP